MNQDLLRQRRNLIATSAFLVLFDIANVQVAKVALLGNELIIGNVQVLIYSAWCLWAYFLLRYYQYWRAEPDQYIRMSFAKHLDSHVRTYINAQQDSVEMAFNDYHAQQDSVEMAFNDYQIVRTGYLGRSYTLRKFNPVTGSFVDLKPRSLSLWRLLYWQLKSALHVALQTTHATDHVLPFMVSIAAPVVVLIEKCPPPWPWLWDLSQSHICK